MLVPMLAEKLTMPKLPNRKWPRTLDLSHKSNRDFFNAFFLQKKNISTKANRANTLALAGECLIESKDGIERTQTLRAFNIGYFLTGSTKGGRVFFNDFQVDFLKMSPVELWCFAPGPGKAGYHITIFSTSFKFDL